METGKHPLTNTQALRHLAEALRIPPRVLGLADTPRSSAHNQRSTHRHNANSFGSH
jgi:hypothetical protein